MTVYKMMLNLPTHQVTATGEQPQIIKIDTDKLISFLSKIGAGYRKNVQYHNDLHGCDVAQSMFMFLT